MSQNTLMRNSSIVSVIIILGLAVTDGAKIFKITILT